MRHTTGRFGKTPPVHQAVADDACEPSLLREHFDDQNSAFERTNKHRDETRRPYGITQNIAGSLRSEQSTTVMSFKYVRGADPK